MLLGHEGCLACWAQAQASGSDECQLKLRVVRVFRVRVAGNLPRAMLYRVRDVREMDKLCLDIPDFNHSNNISN